MSKDVAIFLHRRGQGPENAGMVASAFPGAKLLAPSGGVELRQGERGSRTDRSVLLNQKA
jgi:hypothetical protein